MRKSRNALVAAMALGAVCITGSVASAQTGTADNISQVEGAVAPNFQKSTKAGRATLFAQVQTFDGDMGPRTIVAEATERVTVHFDNDIQVLPGTSAGKFPTCGGQGGSDIDATSTQQAIAECKAAIIGSGAAEALVPTGLDPPAPPSALLELTVTTFNGPTTVPGGPCTPPSGPNTGGPEGCEYVGGEPQIILHAYEPNVPFTTTVGGEVRPSTDVTADYGESLVVNDAPNTAGDAGSLILFGSTVGRTIVERKRVGPPDNRRTVTKLFDYVKATCQDDDATPEGVNLEYDFKADFVYDDNTPDSDTFKQKCGNETSTPAP